MVLMLNRDTRTVDGKPPTHRWRDSEISFLLVASRMPGRLTTLVERLELTNEVRRLNAEAWADFLQHSVGCHRYCPRLYETFGEFQVLLCDPPGTVIAVGHAMPVRWNGALADLPTGLDGILERGVQEEKK